MILLTSYIIKFLVYSLGVIIAWRMIRNRRKVLICSIIMIVMAFLSNSIVDNTSILSDEVTLTALGEQNADAESAEIYLIGYAIDGKEYLCKDSLDLVNGHWFWGGKDYYCWRPKYDDRKPEGVTDSITIRVPVGWKRTLSFVANQWKGIVRVDAGNESQIVDTYSQEGETKTVWLRGSEKVLLLVNQAARLAIYGILCTLYTILLVWCCRNTQHIRLWLIKRKWECMYWILAFFTFIFMLLYAEKGSLWSDEMAQLKFVKGTLYDAVQFCIHMNEVSPPLHNILYNLWYHIIPYGERWLLLPGIFLNAMAVYLIGMTGKRIRGNFCGLFSAIIMGSSTTFWLNSAYEFRAYPFMVFFSTLSLYCFVERNAAKEKRNKWNLFFCISMLGLAMSHYFGMIACGGIFLADLFLIYKKKSDIKDLSAYLFPGIISIGWLGIVIYSIWNRGGMGSAWQPVPGFAHIKSLVQFLGGEYTVTIWIFLAGLLLPIYSFIHISDFKFTWERFYQSFFVVLIIFTVIALVIYGNYIKPDCTMWVNRYFLFLLPHVCMLSGSFLETLASVINEKKDYVCESLSIFLIVVLFFNCFSVAAGGFASIPGGVSHEQFRESANYLYQQTNYIYNDDTIAITTISPVEGWNDYYMTQKGRRDQVNVTNQNIALETLDQFNRIYVVYYHDSIKPELQAYLSESFTLETDETEVGVKVYLRK